MSARKTPLAPADLTPEQRALYDELTTGPRVNAARPGGPVDADGRLTGPFDAMLYVPSVGTPLQRLGAALRYHGTLADDVRELVICATAAYWESSYEQSAHERIALAAGVSQQALDAVRRGEIPEGVGEAATAALRYAALLLDHTIPDDAAYTELVGVLGRDGLFEVSTLVGYYWTLATQLETFGVTP